jgi:hypothetical protein
LAVQENVIGHKLFARSIFSTDHDRGICSSNTVDEVFQASDGRTFSDDFAAGDTLTIEKVRNTHRTLKLGGLLKNEVDLRHRKRLRKVIESPQSHALNNGLDRSICSDHDHERLVFIVGKMLDENAPVAIGQFHVEKDEIERIGT